MIVFTVHALSLSCLAGCGGHFVARGRESSVASLKECGRACRRCTRKGASSPMRKELEITIGPDGEKMSSAESGLACKMIASDDSILTAYRNEASKELEGTN